MRERRWEIVAIGVVISAAGIGLATASTGTWWFLGLVMIPLGLLFTLTELTDVPDHVLAWRTGAEGEEATARALEPLLAQGFRVLHDRRMPGARENLDHVVIGPPGVFVVESKRYSGRVEVRGAELFVGGRRRTTVIAQVERQTAAVRQTLAAAGLVSDVSAFLCIHRAELPLGLIRSPSVRGVPIVSADGLVAALRQRPAVLDPSMVTAVADALEQRLRPA